MFRKVVLIITVKKYPSSALHETFPIIFFSKASGVFCKNVYHNLSTGNDFMNIYKLLSPLRDIILQHFKLLDPIHGY